LVSLYNSNFNFNFNFNSNSNSNMSSPLSLPPNSPFEVESPPRSPAPPHQPSAPSAAAAAAASTIEKERKLKEKKEKKEKRAAALAAAAAATVAGGVSYMLGCGFRALLIVFSLMFALSHVLVVCALPLPARQRHLAKMLSAPMELAALCVPPATVAKLSPPPPSPPPWLSSAPLVLAPSLAA
jgi:hypothetical protein